MLTADVLAPAGWDLRFVAQKPLSNIEGTASNAHQKEADLTRARMKFAKILSLVVRLEVGGRKYWSRRTIMSSFTHLHNNKWQKPAVVHSYCSYTLGRNCQLSC